MLYAEENLLSLIFSLLIDVIVVVQDASHTIWNAPLCTSFLRRSGTGIEFVDGCYMYKDIQYFRTYFCFRLMRVLSGNGLWRLGLIHVSRHVRTKIKSKNGYY